MNRKPIAEFISAKISVDSAASPGGRAGGGAPGFLSLFLLGCLQYFRGARRRT